VAYLKRPWATVAQNSTLRSLHVTYEYYVMYVTSALLWHPHSAPTNRCGSVPDNAVVTRVSGRFERLASEWVTDGHSASFRPSRFQATIAQNYRLQDDTIVRRRPRPGGFDVIGEIITHPPRVDQSTDVPVRPDVGWIASVSDLHVTKNVSKYRFVLRRIYTKTASRLLLRNKLTYYCILFV